MYFQIRQVHTVCTLYNKYNVNILLTINVRVILCQMKVNPSSQIFLKFDKQIELFMLIPKN